MRIDVDNFTVNVYFINEDEIRFDLYIFFFSKNRYTFLMFERYKYMFVFQTKITIRKLEHRLFYKCSYTHDYVYNVQFVIMMECVIKNSNQLNTSLSTQRCCNNELYVLLNSVIARAFLSYKYARTVIDTYLKYPLNKC